MQLAQEEKPVNVVLYQEDTLNLLEFDPASERLRATELKSIDASDYGKAFTDKMIVDDKFTDWLHKENVLFKYHQGNLHTANEGQKCSVVYDLTKPSGTLLKEQRDVNAAYVTCNNISEQDPKYASGLKLKRSVDGHGVSFKDQNAVAYNLDDSCGINKNSNFELQCYEKCPIKFTNLLLQHGCSYSSKELEPKAKFKLATVEQKCASLGANETACTNFLVDVNMCVDYEGTPSVGIGKNDFVGCTKARERFEARMPCSGSTPCMNALGAIITNNEHLGGQ